MNFKNKIILTFFVLLAFILFFNINNVFAFTYKSHNFEREFTVPDLSTVNEQQQHLLENGYVIMTGSSSTSATLFVLAAAPSGEEHLCVFGDYIRIPKGHYRSDIDLSTSNSWGDLSYSSGHSLQGLYHDFYYATTVYTDRNGSDVFFLPPVTEETPEGVTIPALETAEQIPQAIVKTLKILIPVGLIVLSIGFVVYLIKRVRYSIM